MGKSDRKFSQIDDNDLTDSDGGNDSDFAPKVIQTQKRKPIEKYARNNIRKKTIQGVGKDGKIKVKIKNRNRKRVSDRSKSRTPPQTTAPRRKTQFPFHNNKQSSKNITPKDVNNVATQNLLNYKSNLLPSRCNQSAPTSKIIHLQRKVNEMLEIHSQPIPDCIRRIETTFVCEPSYQPPVGVLLRMLMLSAVNEIPWRTTSVS